MKQPSAKALHAAEDLWRALSKQDPLVVHIHEIANAFDAFAGRQDAPRYTTGTRAYVALCASLETMVDGFRAHSNAGSASYLGISRMCDAIERAIARTTPVAKESGC